MSVMKINVVLAVLLGIYLSDGIGPGRELRIDRVVDSAGFNGSLTVRSTDNGFALLQEKAGEMTRLATVTPVAGNTTAFKISDSPDAAPVDLRNIIAGFDKIDFKAAYVQLICRDDSMDQKFTLRRSGGVMYLRGAGDMETYAIHIERMPAEPRIESSHR
jgi:hypothetical protein